MKSLLEASLDTLNLKDVVLGGFDGHIEQSEGVTAAVQNVDENRKQLIDKIIGYYLRHNTSLVGLEDLMDLLNFDRESCDKFPTNKVQIMKLFRKQRDLFDVFFFVKCDKQTCNFTNKISSESSNSKCVRCDNILKTTETNFFVTIPIEQQSKKSVEDNWSEISKFLDKTGKNDQCYSDADDGKVLKDVLEQYDESDVNIFSLCLNLDGANKYKSNTLSVSPIQLIQNYLPPSIRYLPNNVIVSGLFYHRNKPNCREFMLPLIDELNVLNDRKITVNIDGEEYVVLPVITHCSVDLPAKSILQETKQFGSFNGCTYCDIPGELVEIEKLSSEGERKPKKKKKKALKKAATEDPEQPTRQVRYVEGDQQYTLRDEVKTLKTMLALSKSSNEEAINGIKGVSCLVGLKHFNIIFSLGVDYMHTVLLGGTKRLVNYFCNPKFNMKKFYIRPKIRRSLNSKLLSIKPTSNITRKPRSLDDRKHFKASEFRSLLLYYLPVCLPGSVPKVYVDHVRLLSAAVYMLLKTIIPRRNVDEAEGMLHKFVKDHQVLFGKQGMVMVIHLLKHLSDSVRHLGPMWCHSAFPFERNNGCLLKLVNGTTDVLRQMSSKYTLSKSQPKKLHKSGKTMFLGKSIDVVEKSLKARKVGVHENIDLSNMKLTVFKRIQVKSVTYTSLMYTRPKRSVDYFIGLKDSTIGMARFYFEFDNKMHVLIERFDVVENIYHIDKVVKTDDIVLAPIEDIDKKFIFMKVGVNQYIVEPPNPYENE